MVVMPAYTHIEEYYARLQELIQFGGSDNELSIRPAFQNCLDAYCRDHREKLVLVPELRAGAVIPDGTVKDTLRMARGYWEAKDTHDDLDSEIQNKFNRGYPQDNIVFEDSETAVLIQNGDVALRVDMTRPGELHRLIRRFLDYELPNIEEFRRAQGQFKADLPTVLDNLREVLDEAEQNSPTYQAAAADFLEQCRRTIGYKVSMFDVKEMLLQHILTKDIFLRVFNEDQFHRENDIARQLDALEGTFFTGDVRREAIDRLRAYYGVIGRAASEIADYAEKQQFLKAIYEDFYKAYNPAAADRLGVVYTPNEVVDFIIRGADYLLQKHFGRTLADDNVQILDPATGTGTFITNLINYLPADRLEHKYRNEIHANEVAILPYYIANLNIAYSYREKTGKYLEFPNLCFVDTLDNLDWQEQGATGDSVTRQGRLALGGLSEENWIRVQEQNEKPISVIIGNPPYNANQQNWNDNNQNREYPEIDRRISETYIAASKAQKTKQYDMYKRFIRWASDRLADDGIIAFITNRAYLEALQDDGFRQTMPREFSDLYIVDLGGNFQKAGMAGNIFGIRIGVAIGFFVRRSPAIEQGRIHYYALDDGQSGRDKLAEIQNLNFNGIAFNEIEADQKNNWLNQSNSDFDSLLPIVNKETKSSKSSRAERAVFRLYSLGVSTNRDEWVYDFDPLNLTAKAKFFADTYNSLLNKKDTSYPTVIKWSRDLRNEFQRSRGIVYKARNRIRSLYRPFTLKHHFADFTMNDVLTRNHYEMFGVDLKKPNSVICVTGPGSNSFSVLAAGTLVEKKYCDTNNSATFCLPLYRYTEDGKRVSNITEWGIRQFNEHYRKEWGDAFEELAGPAGITAEDIFAYTYAVLHDPVYRHDYRVDLLREFPRLPFYHEFDVWAGMGRELLDLHLNFETAEPYPLERVDSDLRRNDDRQRVRLSAGKESGTIYLDDKTTLTGVPPEAWEYRLGSRSALEWVLDQYKEKKPRDPTIAEKFNPYKFADYKEQVIDLLRRVCTVSVKTVEIVGRMAYWEGDKLRAFGDRERDDFTTAALVQWAKEPEDAEWLEELREIWLETSSGSDCP